ncbi:MAG TPA: hypothetical protein VHL34_23040, partial [Rhizomicrobium sp.]|nr:hypothetical protein [Rhizomicrobium sp.]
PPSRLALDPTDEVILDTGTRTHRLRLTEVNDAAERTVHAEATDPSIYEPLTGPSRTPSNATAPSQPGRALIAFLDLPLLTGRETPWSPHVAAFASPWPGAELIYRSAADANYTLDTTLTAPATMGITTTDFAAGPLWRWDNANAFTLRMFNGTLTSLDDLSVLAGANALAIENEDGDWEIMQFANAELTAPNEWRLTRLLRGQAGTESAMRSPVNAGARVVVLDGALEQLHLTEAERTLPFNVRYGPTDRALSDPAFQSAALQFQGIALRPYAPTHLRSSWSGGDLILTWTRRDRSPASDSWDQSEIPLSETDESYDVEILNGTDVIRTFASITAPTVTYTSTMIAEDFPSGVPTPLTFRVYQLSTPFGRGGPASIT